MTCGEDVPENERQDEAGKRSEARRRKRTSSLAAAGGLANVGVITAYQAGLFKAEDLDILECRHELVKRIEQVNDGNTVHVVGLLMAQAQALALNAIFTKLAFRAAQTDERAPREMETLLRLGLKAQSQSRATLEALVAVGNPPVLFAQQANVAFGPQQVNVGAWPSGPMENEQTVQPAGHALESLPISRPASALIPTQGAASTVPSAIQPAAKEAS